MVVLGGIVCLATVVAVVWLSPSLRNLTLEVSRIAQTRDTLLCCLVLRLNRSWLEVRIVDDKTGEPIAAAVVITDGDGKAVEIEGKHPHVGYLGKRRCYVDGAFSLAAHAT